ncbi:MAG: membrane-bound lytic murein transglycosylase MltF [Steroidobacteraceae bacterium]
MRSMRNAALAMVLLATLLGVSGCSDPSAVARIRARGVLTVATINGPTTYYQGAHESQGAEYELAQAFARDLGVPLRIYTVADEIALRGELDHGRADIVAAGITPNVAWNRVGRATDAYLEIPQLVVARRGRGRLDNIAALRDKQIVVRADGSQQKVLEELRDNGAPWLQWRELELKDHEPLALVAEGNADYAIVDANEFPYLQHVYPNVAIVLTLPDPRSAHWVVERRSVDLATRIDSFFAARKNDGSLAKLLSNAMPEPPGFEFVWAQRLQTDMATLLPTLRPLFEAAAADTGADWRLLAAIGYIESKWQADAASGDGARGIMMLTGDTAASLGVTDRNDAAQNILAGSRYFVQTRDKIPARIPEPDRSWFAMAAYNVGYGHLEDARVIAQARGGSPDRWADVRNALPLLTQEEYYVNARHGYARGWEPARMVDQVQTVLRLLEWQQTALTEGDVIPISAAPGGDSD